jgi:uncharacterized protein YgbK (DUF1537 family)
MNEHWRKKLTEFSKKLDKSDCHYVTIMSKGFDYESDLRQEANLRRLRLEDQIMPATPNALTKEDAEDIIHEYLGKAGEFGFWAALIMGK